MEPTPVPVKLGWWASRSTGTKVLLVVLGVGIVIGGSVLAYNHFNKQDESPKTPPSTPESKPEVDAVGDKKEKKDLYTLPNKGIGCSDVITNHDGNFDYVKCNKVWWIISKENPSNEETKGKHPDWTSLESNEVLTKLLNTRYPKS